MPNPQAILDAARAHADAGRHAQAEALVRRALQSDPRHPDLNHAAALVLLHAAKAEQALFFAERAAKASPTAGPLSTLGVALAQCRRPGEAIEAFRRALAHTPGHIPSALGLANAQRTAHRYEDAVETCSAALATHRRDPSLVATASAALVDAGRVGEAVAMIEEARGEHPDSALLAQAMLFAINYIDLDPRRIFEEHIAYGRALRRQAGPPAHLRAMDPEKRLRIGLVSPDFRAHSVAYFIEPVLEHHDRGRFELICFNNSPRADEVTARLRSHAAGWHEVAAMTDEGIAALVRSRGIDVLVDLSGHTLGHRMGVFALRGAPVQATFIGYPNTTGLDTMDVRLVDSITDPPGVEALAVERLWRMEGCFLCYRPARDAPEPSARAPGSPVTLGSFNVLPKLSPAAVDLWCACLARLPGARLLLKCNQLTDARVRERCRGWFTAKGIDAGRIELLPPTPTLAEHLALYSRLDVALDTYPYAGTTTTCEALWMGVPVVTMEGGTHVSRVGSSLLRGAGLGGLVATTAAEFVERVMGLCEDGARVGTPRGLDLRRKLAASALTQGEAYTRRVEAALREVWRKACAG